MIFKNSATFEISKVYSSLLQRHGIRKSEFVAKSIPLTEYYCFLKYHNAHSIIMTHYTNIHTKSIIKSLINPIPAGVLENKDTSWEGGGSN